MTRAPADGGTPHGAAPQTSRAETGSMEVHMSTDHVNIGFYDSSGAAAHYGGRSGLLTAEIMILFKHHDVIVGSRLLDVGCGAGRTTRFLCQWAGRYVGIDYSEAMVRACSERHGGCQCEVADARDLSIFADGEFDVVLFSHNGIDALPHEDRLASFDEMNRVLRDGGLLIFSTHNRDYRLARSEPRLTWTYDPCAMVKRFVAYLRARRNRSRNKPHERFENEYWIINDRAHAYSLMTYHVDHRTQERQLADAGFETLEVYRKDGSVLDAGESSDDSPWLYFVARKTGRGTTHESGD
ncbi:MAG: methyltransferase domain-containing protein [Candidatus Eisenbacteria bacterium]|nr:methyltransferase domain-containing protein [Candidatus Eisenbacteria bacterium]